MHRPPIVISAALRGQVPKAGARATAPKIIENSRTRKLFMKSFTFLEELGPHQEMLQFADRAIVQRFAQNYANGLWRF